MGMREVTRRERIRAAQMLIGHQFQRSAEHRLCRAIIDVAIADCFIPSTRDRMSAQRFLQAEVIAPAELCGVDSNWIRRVLLTAGLDYRHVG